MLEMSHLRVTINQQRINVLAKQFNENPQQVTASQRESTVKTGINRVHCDIHQHVPVSCRISVFYIKNNYTLYKCSNVRTEGITLEETRMCFLSKSEFCLMLDSCRSNKN